MLCVRAQKCSNANIFHEIVTTHSSGKAKTKRELRELRFIISLANHNRSALFFVFRLGDAAKST